MIINHNLNAMNANRMVNVNSANASKAMAQLSSGLRINSAADDAAGLAISEKMKGQINGLNQASSNAQDGISLTQTADGALSETTSVLQRMRELAVQSSNDTNTTADRTAIQTETTALTAQIDNIANTTQFNTKNLLNGGAGITGTATSGVVVAGGGANVKVGSYSLTNVNAAKASTVTITSGTNAAGTVGDDLESGTAGSITINGTTVSLAANSTGAQIATAINNSTGSTGVSATYTAASGATAGQLVLSSSGVGSAASIQLGSVGITANGAAGDTFRDATAVGGATEQVAMTNTSGTSLLAAGVLSTATTSTVLGADATATLGGSTATAVGNTITFAGGNADGLQINASNEVGANASSTVTISANNALNMQIGANAGQTMTISINSMTSSALGVNALDLTTQSGSESAISAIDTATASVSNTRAQLGAYQNRLQSTINSLGTTSQNLSSAQSSIADVDMAATMAEFSKDNIESQAAQAMISQANQQPQQILQLLR